MVIGAAAFALLGLSLRATALFDSAKFVQAHQTMQRSRIMNEQVQVDAGLARHHRGEAPCFLYSAPAVSSAELGTIVNELAASDALHLFIENTALVGLWSASDERARHGALADEEALASLGRLGSSDAVLLLLHRSSVVAEAKRDVRERESTNTAQIARLEHFLNDQDRNRLRAFWQHHRLKLTPASLLALRHAVQRRLQADEPTDIPA